MNNVPDRMKRWQEEHHYDAVKKTPYNKIRSPIDLMEMFEIAYNQAFPDTIKSMRIEWNPEDDAKTIGTPILTYRYEQYPANMQTMNGQSSYKEPEMIFRETLPNPSSVDFVDERYSQHVATSLTLKVYGDNIKEVVDASERVCDVMVFFKHIWQKNGCKTVRWIRTMTPEYFRMTRATTASLGTNLFFVEMHFKVIIERSSIITIPTIKHIGARLIGIDRADFEKPLNEIPSSQQYEIRIDSGQIINEPDN